jgi:hypothetical protein
MLPPAALSVERLRAALSARSPAVAFYSQACAQAARRWSQQLANQQYLPTLIRYVERNPLRADLVGRAQQLPWSSLAWRDSGARPAILSDWPIKFPERWVQRVNRTQLAAKEKALQRSTPGNRKVECPTVPHACSRSLQCIYLPNA